MKCLILAAGYATRLYPLTENYPKPLLEVAGRPILNWLIGDLEQGGHIDEYLVVTNHKFADIFCNWANKASAARITILDDGTTTNETRLGAVRDIQFAIDQCHIDDNLLVMAGDNLLDFSLNGFLRYAQSKQASCIMRYHEPDEAPLCKCGVATLGPDDRLLALTEKPEHPATHWCAPAFYYLTSTDVVLVQKAIDSGCATDAPGSFIGWLCQHTTMYAWEMPGHRYDIGTLAGYEEINRTYRGILNV